MPDPSLESICFRQTWQFAVRLKYTPDWSFAREAASALRAHSEDRGLISARAPVHGGEIFLGAVGAFAMDSYPARAWGGQPIAARKSRFSAGPRLPEPHERSCSRGFLTR